MNNNHNINGENRVPLLQEVAAANGSIVLKHDEDDEQYKSSSSSVSRRVWIESKKLWHIVGPSILQRVATYSMNIVTQAFAGHLGKVELASITISNSVICGLSFGLFLGMASALETLCGQAFGAKRYRMLGIYMQRSWIILFLTCILLLPLFIFATPIMKAIGQPEDVAKQTGVLALWFIPLHLSFAFQFPIQRFLISQLKTGVLAWVTLPVFGFHILASWLSVKFGFGVVGLAIVLDISWWLVFLGLFGYATLGGCPQTWTGFSIQAFSELWEFLKLSIASGVMLCLENWYYRILLLMPGLLKNKTVAVDALSICMNISGWEMMIPFAFFAATGVRVANELGAGNGKAARFATIVSVIQSTIIGIIFCIFIMVFHHKFGMIFSSDPEVLKAAAKLSYLLAATILLNSVQPILSGVAVGSGWQSRVAFVNIGCYYLVGLPLGVLMGTVLHGGVEGIWGGMIFGGTALQTIVLAILTCRSDWESEAKKATTNVEKWSDDPIEQ